MAKLFNQNSHIESDITFRDFYEIVSILKKPTAVLLAVFICLQPLAVVFAQEAGSEITAPAIKQDPGTGISDTPTPITEAPGSSNDTPATPTDLNESPNPNDGSDEPFPVTPDTIAPDEAVDPLPETVEPTEELSPTEEKLDEEKPSEEKPPGEESQAMSSGVFNDSVGPKNSEASQRLARTDEHTGAAVANYPIVVPPGRNGIEPNLALSYNSQNSEDGSVFGFGWSINIPYIERLNKSGINNLYSTTTPVYFTSSLDGELATTTATSTYVSRVDNGDMRSYTYSNDTWLVKDKSGMQYKFGYASSTQQTDPDSVTRIYKWMLQEVLDTNGNYVTYTYYKDSGQIYPDQITYTHTATSTGIFKVEFLRQSRSDVFPSFKTGFAVRSNYRINEIKTYVNNVVARDYTLSYTTGNNGVRSLFQSIQENGFGEGTTTTTTLPSTVFSYQTANAGYSASTTWAMPTGDSSLDFGRGDQLIDANGDGLADYLSAWQITGLGSNNKVLLRNPNGTWSTSTTHVLPGIFYYETSNLIGVMDDVNGDGLIDFVSSQDSVGNWDIVISDEVYLNNGSTWVEDTSWNVPVVLMHYDHSDNFVRSGDFNGDGLPDLYNESNEVYLNNGHGWATTTAPGYSAPDTQQPSPIKGDINNDAVMDQLHSAMDIPCTSTSTDAQYGKGIGGWATSSSTPPILFQGNNINCPPYNRGVTLVDVDGDGVADMVQGATGGGQTWRKAYRGTGQSWSENSNWEMDASFVINNAPGSSRIVDINGDGLPDFWSSTSNINDNKKADLLSKITLPGGGFSSITYKSSAQYTNPNGTVANPELPLIVYTAQQIATNDGVSTSSQDSYFYKGGDYYFNNFLDKKFAGFSEIQKTDAGGNLTKTFFHTASSTDSSHGEYLDNFWKIGKPYRVEKYDQFGNLFEKTINK